MSASDVESRAVAFIDIPVIRGLNEHVTALDSETEFTRDIQSPTSDVLLSMLPQRSIHTMIARKGDKRVIGQFRLHSQRHAHAVFVAPHLSAGADDTLWLHIFDAMAREAGRYHAHNMIAEVDEDNPLFETMRRCGFAVYARQRIWRRLPDSSPRLLPPVDLIARREADQVGVQSLIANTVPPLLQQIILPVETAAGWVYRKQERIDAFFRVIDGRRGVYLTPFIHPDIMHEATATIDSVIRLIDKTQKMPVYIPVRRYHDWIATALEALGFEPGPLQAVMVRHLTAGVHKTAFSTITQDLPAVSAGSGKPPTSGRRMQAARRRHERNKGLYGTLYH